MPQWNDLPFEIKTAVVKLALLTSRGLAHAVTTPPLKQQRAERHIGFGQAVQMVETLSWNQLALDDDRRMKGSLLSKVLDPTEGWPGSPLDGTIIVRRIAACCGCSNLPDHVVARILFWTLGAKEEMQYTIGSDQFFHNQHRGYLPDVGPNITLQLDIDDRSADDDDSGSSSAASLRLNDQDPMDEDTVHNTTALASSQLTGAGHAMNTFENNSEAVEEASMMSDDDDDYTDSDDASLIKYEAAGRRYLAHMKYHSKYAGADDTFFLCDTHRIFGYQHTSQREASNRGPVVPLLIDRTTTRLAITAAALLRLDHATHETMREVMQDVLKDLSARYWALNDQKTAAWVELEYFCLPESSRTGIAFEFTPYRDALNDTQRQHVDEILKRFQCEWEIDWCLRLVAEVSQLCQNFRTKPLK